LGSFISSGLIVGQTVSEQRDSLLRVLDEYNGRDSVKVNLLIDLQALFLVASLIAGKQQSAGNHSVSFDASVLSSGVYLYRLQAGSITQTKTLTLIK
jgi:hypothetical protein